MTQVIGIDLGTTNTLGAQNGRPLRGGGDGSHAMPSVVAFPPNGATLVGQPAKKRRAIDPQNTIASAKRLMGKSYRSYNAAQARKHYAFDLVATADGGCGFKTRAGTYTPSDIGSFVLGKLLATHALTPSTHDAVIAIPASFDDAARAATLAAAEQAGLRNAKTITEPVATAHAYRARGRFGSGRFAVYDFGGGTFDVAILELSGANATVIGHGGDAYLGGDDIDRAIADWAAHQTLERHHWEIRSSAETFDRLIVQSERAKVRLGFAAQTCIELAQVDPGSPAAGTSLVLDREVLGRIVGPFLSRTFLICDEVLRSAGLVAGDIDRVFLAGGTSLLAPVREGVSSYFGAPAHAELDPLEVVALGASVA